MTPEQIAALISLGSLIKDLGAIGGLLFLIWLLMEGRLVTKGHLNDVVASERAATAKAEAREAEWRRLATRGTDEIAAPLARAVREQLGTQRES